VVSVGTNDAAPWKRATDFESVVAEFVASRPGVAWVFVRSPGVEESRNSGSGDRTNRELAEYADVAAALFTGAGGEVIDAPALLNELGPAAFTDDGVHLTAAAYDVLIPELARACHTNTRTPRHHEGDGATERNE
jgi:lysophospholipase L1-like esterase